MEAGNERPIQNLVRAVVSYPSLLRKNPLRGLVDGDAEPEYLVKTTRFGNGRLEMYSGPRFGRNCKLRRVKCDECKPRCQKCASFGVSCSYEVKSKDSDLQFAGVGAFQLDMPNKPLTPPESPPKSIEDLIDSMLNAPLRLHVDSEDQSDTCYIDEPHLALLRKFYYQSSRTIGTAESSHVYRDCMTRNAAAYDFALHAILRFVLMHDRYLYDPLGTAPSTAESFHGYHAAALFSKKLSQPIEEEAKDALWSTAAILGASTMAAIEATSAYEAWPLKHPEESDLDWLKMSEGKKEVWRLVDPLREGSAFRPAIDAEYRKKEEGFRRPMDPELDKLAPYVTRLYNLGPERNEDDFNDPYFTAASIIERLLPLECTHSTVMWFLSFIGHMHPEYRRLLEEKDPAAMLLLSWWYAKMIPYNSWWLSRRALYEGQAICIHLHKTLSADHEIRRLLEFPMRVCGVEELPDWTIAPWTIAPEQQVSASEFQSQSRM